jgi:hypothetical protein
MQPTFANDDAFFARNGAEREKRRARYGGASRCVAIFPQCARESGLASLERKRKEKTKNLISFTHSLFSLCPMGSYIHRRLATAASASTILLLLLLLLPALSLSLVIMDGVDKKRRTRCDMNRGGRGRTYNERKSG